MRASEATFRMLFNSLDQGFCIIEVLFDGEGQPVDYVFLEINSSFEKNTGLVNAVGKRMRALCPTLEAHWFETYGRIALTGEPKRFELAAAALGRWYDVYAFRVGAPEQHRVAILFDDITARKQVEQALRESEMRFRTLFETITEGFIIAALIRDSTGQVCDFRYLEVAPSFTAITGLAPEAVIGRTVAEVFEHIESPWLEAYRQVGNGIPARVEGHFGALDRWFLASFTPMGNDQVAIIFTDVTERHERERELMEARAKADAANASKSKFLAAASHDLRQPVQSLLLFSQVLANSLADHPARRVVDKMSAALDIFKELLDSLLDLSKLDAGLVTPEVAAYPVAALLQDLVDAYQPRMAAKGLRIKSRLGDEWAMVDATLLRRIVSNLLDNALKYTRRGGVLLVCRQVGKGVRIDVIDTGIGVPREHLDDIFREFVQVGEAGREQKQGMGLGLATVKRLADLLHYEVSVHSKPGRGSCFSVIVPGGEARAGACRPDVSAEAARCCRVLVVDDDSSIVEGLKVYLETAGYDVLTATGVDDAFAILRSGRPPDAVVADYRLGGAVNGTSLIEEARRETGLSLPGIVITGDTNVRRQPGVTLLHKPVTPDLLKKALVEICR